MTDKSQQVDKAQRKILFKTALKLDWRGSTNPFTAMQGKRGKFPGIVAVILMNIFFSFMLTLIFRIVPSFFLGLVLASTGGMVIIAMQLLIEYSHIIISPEDYHVISPLPVNSKTYFQAKLYHLFTFVTILSLSISFFPAVVESYIYGSFILFPIILVQFAFVNYFTAFVIMNIYTFAMKIINRKKIERILLYLQFFFIMMFYLGMQIIPNILKNSLSGSTTETLVWVKLLPSYALSSWYLLFKNGWDTYVFTYFMLAIIVLFGLYKLSVSYLSLSYSESLSEIGKENSKKKFAVPKFIINIWIIIFTIEERVVLKLFWSEFKYNTRFKMQLLTIFPILLYAVYLSFRESQSIVDPFNIIVLSSNPSIFIPLMLSFVPFTVMMAIQYSKSWKASSIFYYTSCDKTKIILASKKNIIILFLLPVSILLVFFYGYFFNNYVHALLYVMFILANLMFAINFISLFSIRILFSGDMATAGKFTMEGFIIMITVPFVMIPIILVNIFGFSGYIGWSVILALLLLINFIVWKFSVNRIKKKIMQAEFLG